MKNMDKGLKVPKWVLINRPKIPQMPQYLSAQSVCPSPKAWDFKKGLPWASIVRGQHIITEAERVIQYNKRKKNMRGEMDSGISVSDQVLTGY